MSATWTQNYDPFGNTLLSTLTAAVPVTLLLLLLAVWKIVAWRAAVYSFAVAVLLAWLVFGMPGSMVAAAVAHGLVYSVIRIVWTLLAAVYVYEITVEAGHFKTIKESIGGITADRRLQVLLIAFAFGAVLEGAGGGGAPVAVAGAMMVGLGFRPFEAAVLCLIANTAPVGFGGMGNPIRTLVAVTGLPEADISATVGRILPWTAMVLPFWLIRTQVKARETVEVWPGLLACGVGFGAIQFFWSNFMDAALVDIMGGMGTLVWLAVFFRIWQPKRIWRYKNDPPASSERRLTAGQIAYAWLPFLLLAALVIIWGLPGVKTKLDAVTLSFPVPGLHQRVLRTPPVVAAQHAEPAVFDIAWLSA